MSKEGDYRADLMENWAWIKTFYSFCSSNCLSVTCGRSIVFSGTPVSSAMIFNCLSVTCGRSVVFSGTPVSSVNKTEILLKVVLNTITLTLKPVAVTVCLFFFYMMIYKTDLQCVDIGGHCLEVVVCFVDIGGHCLEVVVCFVDIGGIVNHH